MRCGAYAFALLLSWSATADDLPPVVELMDRVDDLMRGESSQGTMRMRVKTDRWERELVMSVASKGEEKTLVQILSPAKEKGTATLKVENNIWNYLPKVDRTIKVPGSMMSGAWMGSHFTNDDLVQDSRYSDDYECSYFSVPEDGSENPYVIHCIPNPDAPVVWGMVALTIRSQDLLPERVEFFDEKENLVRGMHYSEIQQFGERSMPTRIRMVPSDKPDEFTEVRYEEMEFDVDIPDRTFSLQALRR